MLEEKRGLFKIRQEEDLGYGHSKPVLFGLDELRSGTLS